MRRGILLGLFGCATLGAAAWIAVQWQAQAGLSRARRAMAAGRFDLARAQLEGLAIQWPGRPEVDFDLGLCAEAMGDLDAALTAWARVPLRTRFSARAAAGRARILQDRGQFAGAEEVLTAAADDADPNDQEVRPALDRLLWYQGRFPELHRRFERRWSRATDRGDALRQLALLDFEPFPVDRVRAVLEQAAARSPDDDRVWLGRANLAVRTGQLDQAAPLLDRCLRRRPHDVAVWRARLDWGLAALDAREVVRCLPHLPVDSAAPGESLALQAWLAARRGDVAAEHWALERLLDEQPGRIEALERLAELAIRSGQLDRAAGLRRQKAERDRARARYRTLIFQADLTPAVPELARLAERLGRRFEARGWATELLARESTRAEARQLLARLDRTEPRSHPPGRTLAQVVTGLGPEAQPESPSAPIHSPPTVPAFVDDAEVVGLRFVHRNGRTTSCQLPETTSGGVALLDYDSDGWLDVYAVQSGPFPPDPAQPLPNGGDRLFRNRGDGTFEDVTAAAEITRLRQGYGHGAAVGDYDNDGHPDLLVTRWRSYSLYRNRGDGTFEDRTDAAGLGGDRDWPTSAAFADLDGDGDLDLYVCHYLAWDPANPRRCRNPETRTCMYCDPREEVALPDHLFRNDHGRFRDVTAQSGVVDRNGPGLGVVAADLDDDGRVDLYVANDTTANLLFRNRGRLRFEDVAETAGVASSASGGYQAGMGVACADLDGDGRPDLAVTNLYGESTTFFQNVGQGLFVDRTNASGLGAASRHLVGFGIAPLDFDNDGQLDLMTANGHINDLRPSFPYAMPAQLLAGLGGGRLIEVSDRAGPPWQVLRLGRGLAVGDLDNDGRVDAVVLAQEGPLAYFHNRTAGGHFLTLRLEGTASNRDAVGARVTITAGGRRQVAQRIGGGSYQSACDPRLHFGLGDCRRVESLEVRWPSGRVDRHAGLAGDAAYLLREGAASPVALPGFRRPAGAGRIGGQP
ncbi:MAG TPA: FG-GAP-like repeat-containing protein [Isosphaeraceae bacterium]|nr:FG-GAP-like repeat-containing protein [Isosphaeraceae bacterium]